MSKVLITFVLVSNLLISFAQQSSDFLLVQSGNFLLPIDNKGHIGSTLNLPEQIGRFNGKSILFSGGFYLTGIDADTIWSNGVFTVLNMNDYIPGVVDSNPLDPKNKIYLVKKSDPDFSQSWLDWVDAVSLGADFYDGNNDGIYNPVDLNQNGKWDADEDKPNLIGDEMYWMVYNDGVPPERRLFSGVAPKQIEIQQTVFIFYNGFTNTVFFRYRILNKNNSVDKLKDVYFTAAVDPDIGDFYDDLIGSDTVYQSGFSYNDGIDTAYGNNPPVIYFSLLLGPPVYIAGETYLDNNNNNQFDFGVDTPLDSAVQINALNGIRAFAGAKNSGLFSVNTFYSPPTLPELNEVSFRYIITNQYYPADFACTDTHGVFLGGVDCQKVNTRFFFSGDFINQIGWINNKPEDQRLFVNTGPFEISKNEPVDIVFAYLVAQKDSLSASVSEARRLAGSAKVYAERNFNINLTGAEEDKVTVYTFKLNQNYPNPFNPSTKISYSIPSSNKSQMSNVKLIVYDVLGREVATLVNEQKPAGNYEVTFDASRLSSGVYFYQLRAGSFVSTKKMILMR